MPNPRFEIDLQTRLAQRQHAKQTTINRLTGYKKYLILDKKQTQEVIENQKLWYANYYSGHLSSLMLDSLVDDWWRANASRYQKIVWLKPKQATVLMLQNYEVTEL